MLSHSLRSRLSALKQSVLARESLRRIASCDSFFVCKVPSVTVSR